MKTTTNDLNRTLLALAMAGLFHAITLAAAERPGPERGPQGGGPPGSGPRTDRGDRGGFGGRGAGMVLDDQQRTLFQDTLRKHQPELGKLDGQLRLAMTELMKATLAGSYDEKAVQDKAGAVARIQTEMMRLRCEALSVVAPTLRPEQQEELLTGRAGGMLLAGGAMDFAGRGPERDGRRPDAPQAQRPPQDPLMESLFPPELVMRFGGEIALTEEQRQAIQSELEKAGPKFEKLNQQIQPEKDALASLLKGERVDLEAALALSDKIQDVEREMWRTRLSLLIGIKNRLTPAQQARLQELKQQAGPGDGVGPGPPQAIQEKMEQLQAGIGRWQREGRNPGPLKEVMRKFDPLMQAGRFDDAERVLDEALRLLEAKRER
jgi:Spy/CpxP family protein refolding chaperone